MSKSVPATAKTVRAYFAANPTAAPEGVDVDRLVSSRGRMPRAAVEAFNKAHRGAGRYVEGNEDTILVTYRHTQPSGRKVKRTEAVPVTKVRAMAGDLAGKRGPLSKAAIDAAIERMESGAQSED